MSPRKRRQHYIDSTVQGSLLRRIVMHWFTFFFVAGFSFVALQALLGDPAQPLMTRLKDQCSEFAFLGVILLAIFPAFLLDTIRFSNRFVGPITRLRRQLRELGTDGETEVLKFRDNDFWIEIAGEFNAVRDMVMEQQQKIDELTAQLESNSESVAGN